MNVGRALLIGAASGLAGGAAMLATRFVERRLSGGKDAPGLTPVTQLAWAAGVGALYGVARTRLRLPRGAKGIVLSGLMSAVEFPGDGRLLSPRRAPRALLPIGARAVFGYATAAAFDLLAGGRAG